uniref:Uncharacterized protein n=1 Tax=Gopherus evgoodei TaxID=1825980 RepID=A0A8C4WMG3_9SAUR
RASPGTVPCASWGLHSVGFPRAVPWQCPDRTPAEHTSPWQCQLETPHCELPQSSALAVPRQDSGSASICQTLPWQCQLGTPQLSPVPGAPASTLKELPALGSVRPSARN